MVTVDSHISRLSLPLTEGLRVRHIAHFGLKTCAPDDDPAEVLKREDFKELDQIPIAEEASIIGVIERDKGQARRIDASVLVSADEALAPFITTLREQSYRLVDGTRITGIVTWSDLLKVPVLLLGYSLLANLEVLLNRGILRRYISPDDWLHALTAKEQKGIRKRAARAAQENLSLPLLEFADLVHKAKVMRDSLPAARDLDADLEQVRLLRNAVAHVHRIVRGTTELASLVGRIEIVIAWIRSLEEHDALGN